MAASAFLTYHNGKLDVPEELQREWQLREGLRFEIVHSSASQIVVRPETLSQVEHDLSWRSLRGSLPNTTPDLNAQLELERQREAQNDRRRG